MEFLSAHKCRAQITISLSTIRMHFYISRQCVECCILEFVATNVGPVMICQEALVYTKYTSLPFAKLEFSASLMFRKNGEKKKC